MNQKISGDAHAAYAAFEKEYRFLKKYPWLDRYRNWMLIFYYREPLSAEAAARDFSILKPENTESFRRNANR